MPITMHAEPGTLYRFEVRGVLRKTELDRCQRALAADLRGIGRVRLLFLLKDFQGWERTPGWTDLGFYLRHGDAIERMAFVGDERWRGEVLMFAAADLRRARVEYFGNESLARAWLGKPRGTGALESSERERQA
jgi:hypothetical protein